jgi:hypothetical protein
MATKSSTSSKDLTNLITMVVTLFLLGTIGHLYGETAHFSLGHITGFHAFLRFLNIDSHAAGKNCSSFLSKTKNLVLMPLPLFHTQPCVGAGPTTWWSPLPF